MDYTENQLCQLWNDCKLSIKKQMSEFNYTTYIEPITILTVENATAHFSVPDDFLISIIEKNFFNTIKNEIIEALKMYVTIQFHLEGTFTVTPSIDMSIDNAKQSLFEDKQEKANLNPKYTFDSFIIGNSNRMAYAAAIAISNDPGNAYNPLFIYGQSGLGKTHLLHAIGNQILQNDLKKNILYIPTEKFTSGYISSIRNNTNEEFIKRFTDIDVLLIDDIQFISGKESTQVEFFHIFNTLYEQKKQIVISSDSPLNEIQILAERLRTRFAWGLITDIQAPDFETKVAILGKKASENNLEVDDEILDYIAYSTGNNIRELESVINSLTMSLTQGGEISLSLAKNALKHLQCNEVHEISASVIIDCVSRFFNISIEDILSKKRTKELVHPIQISMYLGRTLTDMSYPDIGATFNGRDHTTVMYACEQIAKQVEINTDLKLTMEELKKNININLSTDFCG